MRAGSAAFLGKEGDKEGREQRSATSCRSPGVRSSVRSAAMSAKSPQVRAAGRAGEGSRPGIEREGGIRVSGVTLSPTPCPAGSAPPGPVPDGVVRVYSMRFCPFAQRTLLVLVAKGIR